MKSLYSVAIILLYIIVNNISYADNAIVGVWAQPNKASPKVLWYLFPNGEVKTTSNTGYNENVLRWELADKIFRIKSKDGSHSWEGLVSDKIINATHAFNSDGKKEKLSWRAEKISGNPREIINLYSVCSNEEKKWKVVNIGKFEDCQSFVPLEKITSYSYEEAKGLCLSLLKKRKKEYDFKEACI